MASLPFSLLVSVFTVGFLGSRAGRFCTTSVTYQWFSQRTDEKTYCAYDCCGYYPNQYCCTVTAGLVVGGVFSVITVIVIIMAIICCCIKKQTHAGRVLHPAGPSTMTTTILNPAPAVSFSLAHNGSSGQYPHVQPMVAAQPPVYIASEAPPPVYTHTSSAFPMTPSPTNGTTSLVMDPYLSVVSQSRV